MRGYIVIMILWKCEISLALVQAIRRSEEVKILKIEGRKEENDN